MLYACNLTENDTKQLEDKIKDLQTQIDNSYKPGFGELMSGIQVHHSKLWFAGINSNWKLADFEIHEIKEALEDIQKFNGDRSESQSVSMLFCALDSVDAAISNGDTGQFKNSFTYLTNTCNNCHCSTGFEFNVIKIPDAPPYNNQEFKPKTK